MNSSKTDLLLFTIFDTMDFMFEFGKFDGVSSYSSFHVNPHVYCDFLSREDGRESIVRGLREIKQGQVRLSSRRSFLASSPLKGFVRLARSIMF